MKVYFISGMGADRRVFKNIRLSGDHEIVHLDWITAYKNETLAAYALRLAEKIDSSEPFAIVGLSMGGMMAVEIAKHYKPAFTILISSVPSHLQLPGYFRLFLKLGLHKMVPISVTKSFAIIKRLFTAETFEDKKILYNVIKDCDPEFIKWAMHAVLTWRSVQVPESYIHIHGTRDEVLPFRYTQPTHIIKGAGHMMIMTRAAEISRILEDVLRPVLPSK